MPTRELKPGDRVVLKKGAKAGPKPRIGEKDHNFALVYSVDGDRVRLDRNLKGLKFRHLDEVVLADAH